MKVKRTITFNFTEEERNLIDSFVCFIENLDVDSFEALNEVTKGSEFAHALQILWSLAFEENVFDCTKENKF